MIVMPITMVVAGALATADSREPAAGSGGHPLSTCRVEGNAEVVFPAALGGMRKTVSYRNTSCRAHLCCISPVPLRILYKPFFVWVCQCLPWMSYG